MRFVVQERPVAGCETATFATIPWDSETYGFPVIDLRCDKVEPQTLARSLPAWLQSLGAGPSLVYSKVPIAALDLGHVLCGAGFYPVETMLEVYLPISRLRTISNRPTTAFRLRAATESDLPALTQIAATAFRTDRLHLDTQLPGARADSRYVNWVQRAFADNDRLFAYADTRQARIVGFYHVRSTDPGMVDLSLAAVDPAFQHLGVGALLYEAVLLDCQSRGDKVATTHITVNNIEVLNLFARLGASFRHPVVTFHRVQR